MGGDTGRRRAIERFTRAVYDGEATRRGHAPRREAPRWLPGPWSALALVLAAVLIALASVLQASGVGGRDSAGRPGGGESGAGLQSGGGESDGASPGGGSGAPATSRPTAGSATAGPSGAGPGGLGVVVYVTGRVREPGVVELDSGDRVQQAIQGAGGALSDADLAALNLARVAADGEHIVVWRRGEAPPSGAPAAEPSAGGGAAGGSGTAACVDLNTADQAQLETLDGVGPALAQRILAHREQSGPFASAQQLDDVPGIGPAILARIEAGVCP